MPEGFKVCVQCGEIRRIVFRRRKCSECLESTETLYRERRKAASVRPSVALDVWRGAGGACEYCGISVHPKRDKYDSRPTIGEIDHVLPVIMGGTRERENLKLSCKSCNRSRDAQFRSSYLKLRGSA